MRKRCKFIVSMAILVGLSLPIAACSAGQGAPTSGSSSGSISTLAGSPSSPSSAPLRPDVPYTPAATDKPVTEAYVAYWTAMLQVSDPADPTSPLLPKSATGAALKEATEVLTIRKQHGEVMRGSFAHNLREVTKTGDSALVSDCLTTHLSVGQPKAMPSAQVVPPQSVVARMSLEDGKWKVAELKIGTFACRTKDAK